MSGSQILKVVNVVEDGRKSKFLHGKVVRGNNEGRVEPFHLEKMSGGWRDQKGRKWPTASVTFP